MLLNIEQWGTGTGNYRITLYILKNFVWLSYINIEVSTVKPLTVAYVSLHTVIPQWPAVNFMVRSASVGVFAVISPTRVAPTCRSWRRFWFMSYNNNYYIKRFVNFTLLIDTSCYSFILISFFTLSTVFLYLKTVSQQDNLRIVWWDVDYE